IPGAVLLPVGSIDEDTATEVIPEKDSTVLVYCRSGNRSKTASSALAELGYTNIYEFGGISTWPYGKTQAVRRRHGPKAGGRPLGGPHRGGPQTKRRAHLPVCPGQNPEGTAGQAPPGPGGLSGRGAHRGQPHDPGGVAGPVDGGLRRGHPAAQHPRSE